MTSRLPIAIKALFQLGLEPLALYALYKFGLWTGHYERMERRGLEGREKLSTLYPPFSLPPREELVKTLGEERKAGLLKEANEVIAGMVRLFGGEPAPLRLTFDGPLQHWTEYERGKAPIPFSGYPIRDLKFIWEPARFGWAFTLGRAYCVSAEAKYAEAFWKYFEEFAEGNPAYLGPHWMNSQEVGIRLMALVWAAQVFQTAEASTAERRARLIESIAQHARRIPTTLVYARSQNNNHLVVEATALFTAGAALDQPHWRAHGWEWLNRALRTQISTYGEYIQHSTNYHRLMLQSVLWADAILRGRGEHWPSATLEALMRASHWLFSMIDPGSGRVPNLGANDGALILPLSSAAFDDYRPTVQAAARAFLRIGLPPGKWDELSIWLGLRATERTADSDAYMAEHLRGKNSWGYLRASRFESRLSHMDQLHFDLWWRGENVAQDPGTYLYNAEAPWNNPLVSTRVHNTITIDEQDQMTRGGRFLTLDWSPAYSKRLLEVDERILGRMLAYHKGYRRLGLLHERVATVLADEHWEIRDNLIFKKPGEHIFRLHWLLQDGEWEIGNRESGTQIHVRSPHGWISLSISGAPLQDGDCQVTLVRAGELIYGTGEALPFEGWASRTYGEKVPALSLAFQVRSSKSLSLTSEFMFPN
jgi:hypothetical protein